MSPEIILPFVYQFILNLIGIVKLFIFLSVIFSWFNVSRHPIVQFINRITAPILSLVKSIMPRTGMLDFSPIIAIIMLMILENLVRAYFPLLFS